MFAREGGIFERIEREDAHVKSASAFCDLFADSSQTNDTDRGATDLATQQEERTPGLPLTVTDVGYRLWNSSRGSQQQRPGVIGGRVGQHLRGVADKHTALGGRGDVDVVVADREVRDYAQTRVPVEHGTIDLIGK